MNKNKILETWLKWLRNGEWYNVTDDIERLLLEPERDVCWCGVPLAKPEQASNEPPDYVEPPTSDYHNGWEEGFEAAKNLFKGKNT